MPPALGVLALWGSRGHLSASGHIFADLHRLSVARRTVAGLLAGVVSFGMSGCGASDFTSSSLATLVPTSSQPVVTTKAKAKATATATATAASTSTLGVLPPVLSTSSSPVDAAVVTSLADLPAAFGCPKVPQPIVVPASGDKPPALVCRSQLAEAALFLWYVDDADSKYRAVKAALATARYVRAGRHWVAGGMVDKTMGSVGGDVFKQ